jgi:CspA family cold shock protein
MTGTIERLLMDKGFGFIKSTEPTGAKGSGVEYFFHRSAVKNAKFEDLTKGQEVTFEDSEGTKGPRAEDVYV